MKPEFEKVKFETIDSERCEHDFIIRADPLGWVPIRQCRKCKGVQFSEIVYQTEEIRGTK